MNYLALICIPFFILLAIYMNALLGRTNDMQCIKYTLNKINNACNTNFRSDRQIASKIFFDTYLCKLYFYMDGLKGIKDINFLTRWEIVSSPDKKSNFKILIETCDPTGLPIEIEYQSYDKANADLEKLNSMMNMLSHNNS